MGEIVFGSHGCGGDGGKGRGAIVREFLRFELSERGRDSETAGFHQVQSDVHHDSGHSPVVFP